MTKEQRKRGGARSVPGRDFSDIPGAGGGRRVVADPNGGRAARRKHQRRGGRPVETVVIDDLVSDQWVAANALVMVSRRLAALHWHSSGGLPFVNRVGLFEVVNDVARELLGPTWPAVLKAAHAEQPGPAPAGDPVEILDQAEVHRRAQAALMRRLAVRLGLPSGAEVPDPGTVIPAVLAALAAAAAVLAEAEPFCHYHRDNPPERTFGSGCESCQQPIRVRAALAALAVFAPDGDPA